MFISLKVPLSKWKIKFLGKASRFTRRHTITTNPLTLIPVLHTYRREGKHFTTRSSKQSNINKIAVRSPGLFPVILAGWKTWWVEGGKTGGSASDDLLQEIPEGGTIFWRRRSIHVIGRKGVSKKGPPPLGWLLPRGGFSLTRCHLKGLVVYEKGWSFALLVLGATVRHFTSLPFLGCRQNSQPDQFPRRASQKFISSTVNPKKFRSPPRNPDDVFPPKSADAF